MASRRQTQGNTAQGSRASAAGPSRSSILRQHDRPPVSAYGAPPSVINSHAIGYDGHTAAAAGGGGNAALDPQYALLPAPLRPRPIEELLALNLTLQQENHLPRAERNLLRDYRTQHGIARTASIPLPNQPAMATATERRSTAASTRAAAAAASASLNVGSSSRAADADADARRTEHLLNSQPTSDVVPGANGSGAQRRDPFVSYQSSRARTHSNAVDPTGLYPLSARGGSGGAGPSASGSRSGTGTGSDPDGGRRAAAARGGGVSLGLASTHDMRPSISGFAMRAPGSHAASSSTSSHHSSSGGLEAAERRRAQAAAAGTTVPASSGSPSGSGSDMTLSARRYTGSDDDGTGSESAGEGRKHTRRTHLADRHGSAAASSRSGGQGAGAAGVGIKSDGRATPATPSRKAAGKAAAVASAAGVSEDPDQTVVGPSTGKAAANKTPRRAAASRPASAVPPVRQLAPRSSFARQCGLVILFGLLFPILVSISTVIASAVIDPLEVASKLGFPMQWLPPRRVPVASTPDGAFAGTLSIPSDVVRTPALDTLSKKVDKLGTAQRRDRSALEQKLDELMRQFGSTEAGLEQLVLHLSTVRDRVDALDKMAKTMKEQMSASASASAPLRQDRALSDVVTFADLRRYHADRTGREDLLNPVAGARIVPSLTTWTSWWGGTYGVRPRPKTGWTGFVRSRLAGSSEFARAASDPNAHNPSWALMPTAQAGHCWLFPATGAGAGGSAAAAAAAAAADSSGSAKTTTPTAETYATLGVDLVRPARIGAFSLEHIARELVPDQRSAPRELELWGVVDVGEAETMERVRAWRARMEAEMLTAQREAEGAPPDSINAEWDAWLAEGAGQPQSIPPSEGHVLLATMEYSLEPGTSELQMAEVRPSARRLDVAFKTVMVRIKGNHGAPQTCVYRLRVHPQLEGV